MDEEDENLFLEEENEPRKNDIEPEVNDDNNDGTVGSDSQMQENSEPQGEQGVDQPELELKQEVEVEGTEQGGGDSNGNLMEEEDLQS